MTVLEPDDPHYWHPQPFFEHVSATAAEHGLRIVHHPLGPLEEGDAAHTAVAAVLKMPPGYTLPRHSHSCDRLEVIVKGSLTAHGKELGPGTLLLAGPDEFYGPHIAGPEGCTTVEVFASLKGVGRVTLDTPKGPTVVSYRDKQSDGTRNGQPKGET